MQAYLVSLLAAGDFVNVTKGISQNDFPISAAG
jgi:hypothetical protein